MTRKTLKALVNEGSPIALFSTSRTPSTNTDTYGVWCGEAEDSHLLVIHDTWVTATFIAKGIRQQFDQYAVLLFQKAPNEHYADGYLNITTKQPNNDGYTVLTDGYIVITAEPLNNSAIPVVASLITEEGIKPL